MLQLTHSTPAPGGNEPPDLPWLPLILMAFAVLFALVFRWCALHLVP